MIVDTSWHDRGACKTNPEQQYPEPGDSRGTHAARRTCNSCPVRSDCLLAALRQREEHGVWGGFTPGERRRLIGGRQARRCTSCRLWFVPGSDTVRRCYGCPASRPQQPAPATVLAANRANVTQWAADGWSDRQIAAALNVERATVTAVRRSWGIPSGWLTRRAVCHDTATVRPKTVDAAHAGRMPFADLTLAERAELWRRHVADGGTGTQFCTRYRVSWHTARQIRDHATSGRPVGVEVMAA